MRLIQVGSYVGVRGSLRLEKNIVYLGTVGLVKSVYRLLLLENVYR